MPSRGLAKGNGWEMDGERKPREFMLSACDDDDIIYLYSVFYWLVTEKEMFNKYVKIFHKTEDKEKFKMLLIEFFFQHELILLTTVP